MFSQSKHLLVVLAFLLHNGLLFSQGNVDCPSPTFFKTFGTEFQSESGTAIVRSNDNHLFLAGRNGGRTFIQKMTTSGVVVWTRDFRVNAFESVMPSEIIQDSEGMIVGCGIQGQIGLSKGFAFRYDPINNVLLWATQITSNNPTVGGILEKGAGGNFILYQNALLASGEREAEIIEIDRVTGNVNPSLAKRYEYISSDVLSKMIYVDSALYATGTSSCRFGNINLVHSRQLLMRFDPGTFDPIWAHLNHLDTLRPISFLGRDLVADSNSLVSAYSGSNEIVINGNGDENIYLQKTDREGNILWVRSYNVFANVLKLISVPDGYVVYGQFQGQTHVVFKTDKNGLPVWGRSLTESQAGAIASNNFSPNQAISIGDSLYFTGVTVSGASDVLLWKMLGNGNMVDSCGLVDTFSFEATLIENPFRTLADFSQVFSTATGANTSPTIQATDLLLNQICPDCSVPDICPEDNDFIVAINDVFCEAGKINMQFTFCDIDGGSVPALTISFFDANPYTQTANLLGTYDYSPVTNDSCWSAELTDLATKFGVANVQNGEQIFAVVNVPGNAETPFVLADFPLTAFSECDYSNNMDVFTIQFPTAPILNLGPDKSVCSGQTATLSAGAGYFRYQWSNGQTTPVIDVNFSGQFRVTVTDFCGFRQSDTIEVVVRQAPLLAANGAFCPGKSVVVAGFEFNQSGIFQEMLSGSNGDCDTLITFFITELPYQTRNEIVRFCPGETVTINGITYEESGLARDTFAGTIGCDTIVFYFLNELPAPFRLDTAYICPGDSVLVGDYYYSQPGLVFDTLPSLNSAGCDTVLRVRIIELPQITVPQTIQFCPGTSVSLQGQLYNQPGLVSFIVPSTSGGCDTLFEYNLEWLPGPTRAETVQFCPGTSVEIVGVLYTQPGIITATISGIAGQCDTLVTYTLEWLPGPTRSETIEFCPGASVQIGGNQYTQPGTVLNTVPGTGGGCDTVVTYTLSWLTYQTDAEAINFCPGQSVMVGGNSYNQPGTVVDTIPSTAGGCDVIVTYTLVFASLPTRSETLEFCAGSSVQIAGQSYTLPGTVVTTLPGAAGACDTVVTYTLQYADPLPSTLEAKCPFNVGVVTVPGTGPIVVNYPTPTATSDCICPGIAWTLSSGLPSGSLFSPGITKICYIASDSCGSTDECCFNVTVREVAACDSKTTACVKYDILGISADAAQRYTYRIRVTNMCAAKLSYTAIQLPDGVVAASPASNAVYTSPESRNYLVRNPNYAPFYSIRFKTTTDSIANGQSSILTYTLPAQSRPNFIRIISRLEPQVYYEATLNTFNCPIGVTTNSRQDERLEAGEMLPVAKTMLLYPNPSSGAFFVDVSDWEGEQIVLWVLDGRGQQVQLQELVAGSEAQLVTLPESLVNGLYFLEIQTENGAREVVRFVVER